MRVPLTSLVAAASIALGLGGAPARATTVGGHSADTVAPFALAGQDIVVPHAGYDDPGDWIGGDVTTETDVSVLRPSRHTLGTLFLAQASATIGGPPTGATLTFFDPPAIAAAGDQVAVAWRQSGAISSALLSRDRRQAVGAATPITGTGTVGAFDVAVEPGGRRAIAWSDAAGVHLDVFGAAGDLQTTAMLPSAPATAAGISVARDGQGGWWAVWEAGASIDAVHVTSAAVVGPAIDLAPDALDTGAAAQPPGGDAARPWTIVPDGTGGIWVGLRRRVVHATDAGARAVASSPAARALSLADGDGSTAVARDVAGGRVAVARLGTTLGATTRVRGRLLAVAFDHERSTIEMLTEHAHGRVYLTRVGATGHAGQALRLTFCNHARTGQLLAAGGLVAVACAGRDTTRYNVDTGGDARFGHIDRYRLLRGNRVIARAGADDGSYDY